ncbi:IS110 family transposase, partial [Xanthomonas vasicola]
LQRVKTDRSDAKLIASYGLRHRDQLRAWHPDPPALKTLKALVRRRDDLLQMLQMERNRLEVAQANGQDRPQRCEADRQLRLAPPRPTACLASRSAGPEDAQGAGAPPR